MISARLDYYVKQIVLYRLNTNISYCLNFVCDTYLAFEANLSSSFSLNIEQDMHLK